MNVKQKIVVLVMDLLLLVELTWSIYLGHGRGDEMTAVFLRTFLPLALVTVVSGRLLVRRWRAAPVAGELE
ncbi:MAG: hypothetical protein SWC40_09210 [Thermodesulfobacteriota bacterium]|nr:hypothetical protein [Thermodesulfobacteriota bacterium]